MIMNRLAKKIMKLVIALAALNLVLPALCTAEEPPANPVVCPRNQAPVPDIKRSSVYDGYPFKEGEVAKYEMRYGLVKVLVGYGFMRVLPPIKQEIIVGAKDGKPVAEKRYHMVFDSDAYTGEWYKMIFAAHDKIQALSRSWDFGISRFYINQDEEKPFVRRYRLERWLDYRQAECKVTVREKDYIKNTEKNGEFDLQFGATDALGAVYKLRTYSYSKGRPATFTVYSSEKNWLLEAHPMEFEKLTVNAGTFDTVKLSMKTYIGKELNQRGELNVWIAVDHPNHPMVKVEGSAAFGSFYLTLDEFKAGS